MALVSNYISYWLDARLSALSTVGIWVSTSISRIPSSLPVPSSLQASLVVNCCMGPCKCKQVSFTSTGAPTTLTCCTNRKVLPRPLVQRPLELFAFFLLRPAVVPGGGRQVNHLQQARKNVMELYSSDGIEETLQGMAVTSARIVSPRSSVRRARL